MDFRSSDPSAEPSYCPQTRLEQIFPQGYVVVDWDSPKVKPLPPLLSLWGEALSG